MKIQLQAIYSVGHSNRSLKEFIALLKEYGVELVVDVRRFPTSKWEWFRGDRLKGELEKNGLGYMYLGSQLGGFRKGGYLKHMGTQDFREGVEKILKLAEKSRIAIMCAEKIVYRCHRRHISRYLQQRGVRVIHIADKGKCFDLEARRKRKSREFRKAASTSLSSF